MPLEQVLQLLSTSWLCSPVVIAGPYHPRWSVPDGVFEALPPRALKAEVPPHFTRFLRPLSSLTLFSPVLVGDGQAFLASTRKIEREWHRGNRVVTRLWAPMY